MYFGTFFGLYLRVLWNLTQHFFFYNSSLILKNVTHYDFSMVRKYIMWSVYLFLPQVPTVSLDVSLRALSHGNEEKEGESGPPFYTKEFSHLEKCLVFMWPRRHIEDRLCLRHAVSEGQHPWPSRCTAWCRQAGTVLQQLLAAASPSASRKQRELTGFLKPQIPILYISSNKDHAS